MPDTLSYAVYYGATRGMSAKDLQQYDVVVTTYQTVAGEHNNADEAAGKRRKKDKGSLFGVSWKVRFRSPSSPVLKGVGSDAIPAYCTG
jgi:SWI/SNF-related matrix-associated actin-dependent regulator of chromatin subfamily A3